MNKMHEVSEDKEILINKMYVGSYLENENNIGHEVINLLRADGEVDKSGDGQNYIYIQSWGTMEKEHNNQIDTILLVRNTGIADTLEILAQAWDLEQIAKIKAGTHESEIEDILKEQIEYITKTAKVKYNGKFLNNIYYGQETDENKNDVFITFKANKLRKPKKPLFVSFSTEDKNINKLINSFGGKIVYLNTYKNIKEEKYEKVIHIVNMAKASLKMYFKNEIIKSNKNKTFPYREHIDQRYAFKQLKNICEDKTLWEEKNTTESTTEIKNSSNYSNNNFIDLIDKQYAEVTYSNLFKHIFESDRILFQKFAEEVLSKDENGDDIKNEYNKKLCINNNITVERENAHIDLLIQDANNVIVIENKIKSGINGIKYDIHGDLVGSQLSDYYHYIKNNDEFNKKNSFFYIFAPDYNRIDTDKIQNIKGVYKIIPYHRIYNFFRKYDNSKIPYFKEFLYALEKHINSTDNVLEIETHRKFMQKINKTRSN